MRVDNGAGDREASYPVFWYSIAIKASSYSMFSHAGSGYNLDILTLA